MCWGSTPLIRMMPYLLAGITFSLIAAVIYLLPLKNAKIQTRFLVLLALIFVAMLCFAAAVLAYTAKLAC